MSYSIISTRSRGDIQSTPLFPLHSQEEILQTFRETMRATEEGLDKEWLKRADSKSRMQISLLSPSKPEVQAQVKVCRSLFVSTKSAAPYFLHGCIYLSLHFHFLPQSLPLCVCLNILNALFFLSPVSSMLDSVSLLHQRSRFKSLSLTENIQVSSEASPGRGLRNPGKMPQPSIHDKSCQSKLSSSACQHCWINQKSPGRFIEMVKKIGTCLVVIFWHIKYNVLIFISLFPPSFTVIKSNRPLLLWKRSQTDWGQSADTAEAQGIQMESGDTDYPNPSSDS